MLPVPISWWGWRADWNSHAGIQALPLFLLNYGKYIWQLYASQQRGVHLSGNSWLSRDQLITKNDDAYEDAEREVMAVSSVPVIRNTFLLHSKNARPRREVVASISLILFSDVFDLNTTMTLKKAARIIGMAIDSDDIRGGILARICLGELISASSIIIKTDESLHLSPAFAQYLSGGDMSVEIGSSPNQILVHASCHKKRAALRKVKLAEEIKGELKQLKAEGSPILDVMRKRVVE